MKNKKLFVFVLAQITLFSNAAFGYVAVSQMVRGKVTILPPHAVEAHTLKKGEKIEKDSSILTHEKSLAILMMTNHSKLTVGPNSKIVVKPVSTKKVGVVGLLTGALRADVEKDAVSKGNKLFIKTKTAALGVRGTSFQARFNPKNKTTSLLTFNGKVAMANLTKKEDRSIKNEVKVLEKKLVEKKSAVVTRGQYASSLTSKKENVVAVRISPKQFTLIKLNKNFGTDEKEIDHKLVEKEIEKTKVEFAKIEKIENHQIKEAKAMPKKELLDGGYVDLKSGFYIPPTKKVDVNEKKSEQALEEIGKVDDKGNYVPPQGVKLDAVLGFVVEQKNEKAVEKVAQLNNKIKTQVIEAKIIKNNLDNIGGDAYDKYYQNWE